MPVADWLRLDFPGLARPVLVPDDAGLTQGLDRILRGWTPRVSHTAQVPADALAWLVPQDGAYCLHSTLLDAPLPGLSTAAALCGLVADLAQCFYEQRPGSLALHCGAVRIAGRLVALAGSAHAGKSTLVARLGAEADLEIFGDDVLPLLPDGQAYALGIAPRLRLPLPAASTDDFRAHVARRAGPSDGRYAYVATPNLAPHGTRGALAALVVLQRRPRAAARLHRVAPAEALHHLLARNMAGTPDAAFGAAQVLASGLACVKLVYSGLDDAAALLRQAFGRPATGPPLALGPEIPPIPARRPPVPPHQTFRRAARVVLRRHGEAAFLWHAGEAGFWHLNAVAHAVWAMLEEPCSAAELAEALAEVFTDIPAVRLRQDVAALLGGLALHGLIEPSKPR
ncbi:PqqD family peptide modification chaperone [Falsiroseomonas sp. HC035]|uniref:PqqD family peptide modification chaperone n=1 Tax=Falsiroseomonas sp. HC035 TaxID=3390999 RepID=UPI003D313D77